MKICSKMFHDLNFEPHAISPCCNTRALSIPAFPYEGGEIDLGKYAAHIENTLLDIQNGGNVCKNCPELIDIDGVPNINGGQFNTLSINMHRYFCNCKCVYCGFWKGSGKGYDILPALQSLKEQGALATNCTISWGGGEPSILSTFDKASEWALKNNYIQIVHTNAIRYSNSIEQILRNQGGLVNISLDSSSPQVYRSVKGVDCYDKVVENLKKYSNACADLIQLKYIVFEKNNNFGEIEKFLRLALDLGIGTVEYSLNFVELNNGTISEKTLHAAAFLEKRAKELGIPNLQKFFIDPKWQAMIEERMHQI